MGKNITISVLVLVIVGLLGYVVVKNTSKPDYVESTMNTQSAVTPSNSENPSAIASTGLPTGAVLLASSADKMYSAYTAFTVSDRGTKLPQIFQMTEHDIPGKGDTVYLKNNTNGEVTQIFSDASSQELSVKNGQFLTKNNLFLFETGTLFSYNLSSKTITKHSVSAPNGCATGNVQFISPNETSIVVSGWCGQEGGQQSIIDLNSWKVSWSVQAGIGAGKTIQKYNSDQTVLVAVDDDIRPVSYLTYSLDGTLIQHQG